MAAKIGYSVADLTELKNITSSVRVTGYIRSVIAKNAWYMFSSTSTATADDDNIVVPTSGTGRWYKITGATDASAVTGLSDSIISVIHSAQKHAPYVFITDGTAITLEYNKKYIVSTATPNIIIPASSTASTGDFISIRNLNSSRIAINFPLSDVVASHTIVSETHSYVPGISECAVAWNGTQYVTVSTTPFYIIDTIPSDLLLHFAGTDGSTVITDSSTSPKTVTIVGSAVISTTQSKFGGSSLYIPRYSYITITGIPFNTSDFTVEFFAYFNSNFTDSDALAGYGSNKWSYAGYSNQLSFWQNYGFTYGNSGAPSSGTWRHFALTYTGGTLRAYINGTETFNTALSYNFGSDTLYIGRAATDIGKYFDGYIDEVRVIIGTAVYTSNFTPTTVPFE